MPRDIPQLLDAQGRLLDKTVRPGSHGRRLVSRRAKITEVGDDVHKFVFLESEFTEAIQSTNIDPTDTERGVEKYGYGGDTFRVGQVVTVDLIDEQWWIRREGFQVGRLVGSSSATSSSSSSATPGYCRPRIWDVLPITAEFPELAGLQDVTTTDRDDSLIQAVEPPGLSLQAGDIVSMHRANNAYWWILQQYCSMPTSSSSSASLPSSSSSASSGASSAASSGSGPSSSSGAAASSSSGSVIAACGCPSIAAQWTMTVAGITNGTCFGCPQFNGTHTLTYCALPGCTAPFPGYWISPELGSMFGAPICGPDVQRRWRLRCDIPGLVHLDMPAVVGFRMPIEDFDCLGPNTFTAKWMDPLTCWTFPATITVTPI